MFILTPFYSRVVMPLTVEEYQVAQLWSVAKASEEETGGGEGVEVFYNEPFDIARGIHSPETRMLERPGDELGASRWNNGQYTLKWYRFGSRIPWLIRKFIRQGALDMREEAWNAFPYCRTIITVFFALFYLKDRFSFFTSIFLVLLLFVILLGDPLWYLIIPRQWQYLLACLQVFSTYAYFYVHLHLDWQGYRGIT